MALFLAKGVHAWTGLESVQMCILAVCRVRRLSSKEILDQFQRSICFDLSRAPKLSYFCLAGNLVVRVMVVFVICNLSVELSPGAGFG